MDDFPLLAEASPEGAWVFEVPKVLATELSQLNDTEIPNLVSKWLQTEEMQNSDRVYAEKFVKDFKSLASEATNTQKSLLMWMSL